MRHERVTDEIREQAALHALGMLEPEQASAFQTHLEEGCEVCESELQAFSETASQLPLALRETAPDPAVRERLLARTRPQRNLPPGPHVVRSEEGAWESAGFEGVSIKQLYVDPAREEVTVLVRMAPGATYPAHRHAGIEHCLMLEGDLRAGDLVLRAGDYQCAASESLHQVTSTEQGYLLLVIASQHNELLA